MLCWFICQTFFINAYLYHDINYRHVLYGVISNVGNYFIHINWKEILRFGIVGIIATGIHYGVYVLCLFFTSANIAYTLGWIISLCCNFYLSARFTFRKHMSFSRAGGFVFSHIVNYLMHIGLLNLCMWIGIGQLYAPLVVFCIVIPINFILVRFVFNKLPWKRFPY